MPRGVRGADAAKPNSVFNGVRIGCITYSYRGEISSAADTLKALIEDGLSEIELMDGPIQSYAGMPKSQKRGILERAYKERIPIMATERVNDLSAFKGFIDERLANGQTNLTLDEALINWELENQSAQEREETLEAIRLGLDDMYAGRTVDAFEFVERMRQMFQAPAKL